MGFSFFLNMLFLCQCHRGTCCGLGTVWVLGMQLPKWMGCACLGLYPGLGRAHDELPSDRKEETAVGGEETAETRADEQHRRITAGQEHRAGQQRWGSLQPGGSLLGGYFNQD